MEVDLTMKSDLEEYLEQHPEFIQKWLLEKASPETVQEVLSGCSSAPRSNSVEDLGESSHEVKSPEEAETRNHNNNNRVHQNKNSSSGSSSVSPSSGNTISNFGASMLHSTSNGGGGGGGGGDEFGDSGEETTRGNCGGGVSDESAMIQRARSRSKRNSITSDRFQSWLSSSSPKCSNRRTERRFTNPEDSQRNLRSLDENALFIELVKDISNELDIDVLCHKILVNVGYLSKAQRSSLYLARGPSEQRYLVPKLLDVTCESDIEDCLKRARSDETRIPFGVGIPGHVAQSKEIVNIKNAYEDSRFQNEVETKSGYKTWSILALPVSNNEGEVIGVAQVINKKSEGDHQFDESDIEVIQRYLTFCGIGVQNAQLFETSVAEYRRNQLLLNLARSIFEEQTNLERLVTKIMKEAQGLLRCERSLVYLRDVPLMEASHIERILMMPSAPGERKPLSRRESKTVTMKDVLKEKGLLFELVFELTSDDQEEEVRRPSAAEISNSPLTQIAKYVATNSEILNIGDAITWYRDSVDLSKDLLPVAESSFYNSLPKSILCMPIYNGQRQVIGVAQLINKVNNQPFTDSDANTFEAFAIFCGLGIHNTQLYESACKLMAKQSVALECLSYHATASCDDTERLRRDEIPSSDYYNLYSYIFNDFSMTDSDTCKATIRMFLELNLVSKYHIPYPVLCRWVLSVKKNYRPVKYHNWRHAFNVAQTMFTVLTTGRMGQFLDDLDILGLIVACLCHDLDHRGTNNAFQQQSASPLAVLYSTSTMEHHHFDQCVMILSSEGNNIFQDLSADNYRKVMKIVEKSILSTDLAMYFRKKDRFIELVEEGEISWQGDDKKELLCGMMMTACDVAAISKPWEIQHKIAKLVADEFFDQGDLEKEQLNLQPQAMMDRDRKDELPKMQLSFIDVICCPLYKVLSETFPWLKPLYDGVNRNRQNWQDLAEKVDMGLTWIDYDVIEKPVEEFSKNSEPQDINFVVQNLNCSNTESGDAAEAANRRNKSRWKLKRLFRDSSQLRKSTSIQSKVSSSDVSSPLSKKDDQIGPPAAFSPSTNNSPSKLPPTSLSMQTSPEKVGSPGNLQVTSDAGEVVEKDAEVKLASKGLSSSAAVQSTTNSSKASPSPGTSTHKKNNCMIS